MEPPRNLTTRQQQIFDFITQYIRELSKPPTFREIGKRFAIKSTNGVKSLLTAIEKKGFLKVYPRISRGIQLTTALTEEASNSMLRIPILGQISAGLPLLAVEHQEDSLLLDPSLLGKGAGSTFALRVKGDSMIGAGILPGDLVIVRQAQEVKEGEIIVAIINSDATVKRFYKENEHVVLKAENKKYPPIRVDPNTEDLQIAGKVIGVIRKY
jgi:repressor LexA